MQSGFQQGRHSRRVRRIRDAASLGESAESDQRRALFRTQRPGGPTLLATIDLEDVDLAVLAARDELPDAQLFSRTWLTAIVGDEQEDGLAAYLRGEKDKALDELQQFVDEVKARGKLS